MESSYIDMCRVCLKKEALVPLFDLHDDNKHCLTHKFAMCLREKIEDVPGYPRNICNFCNETLDDIYEFVEKFKKSSSILENEFVNVKIENEETNGFDNECFYQEDVPIDFNLDCKEIKTEQTLENNMNYKLPPEIAKLLNPLTIKVTRVKTETIKNSINVNKPRIKKVSLLEESSAGTRKKLCNKQSSKNGKILTKIKEIGNLVLKKRFINKKNKNIEGLKNNKSKRLDTKLNTVTKKKQETKCDKFKNNKTDCVDITQRLCEVCGKVCENQRQLYTHITTTHKNTEVKCDKCSRVFRTKHDLRRHEKNLHSNDKKFHCNECGKKFAFRYTLIRHIKNIHENEKNKNFMCKLCSKSYKCMLSLVIHERSIHTGERPAVCTVCDAKFFHEVYLKEHMRLHTGETPFKCPICGRGYAQRGNMKSHIVHNHKISDLSAKNLRDIQKKKLQESS